jgi:uncharacterized membrane protein YedE/YeeE
MNRRMYLVAVLSGAFMAVGLALGGLTRPEVIIGWMDFFGRWNPTLLIFLAGAVGAYHLMFRWARARENAGQGPTLCVPGSRAIDARLLVGASIFGVGWGLAGVCPGPALTSLGAGTGWAVPFIGAMIMGLLIGDRRFFRPKA